MDHIFKPEKKKRGINPIFAVGIVIGILLIGGAIYLLSFKPPMEEQTAKLLIGLVATDSLTIWWLYIVVFVYGMFETVYDGAIRAVVPSIVDRANLPVGAPNVAVVDVPLERGRIPREVRLDVGEETRLDLSDEVPPGPASDARAEASPSK